MKLKTLLAGFLMLAFAASAGAFPTWMGVYGSFERHSAGNPGTYTVLMNQDYWGLNAEVGVQVIHSSLGTNSGKWQVCAMAYAGNKDGNSIWKFTPAQAYPGGATVNFYFHGKDGAGANIWDSAGGKNYSFTAEPVVVFKGDWGAELNIPHASGAYGFDVAASGGTLFAVWQEGGYYAGGNYLAPAVMFSRKAAGHSWEMPRTVAAGSWPCLAASTAGVFVLYTATEWPQTASLVRSTNQGLTWGVAVTDSFQTRYARLRADGSSVYVAYDEFTAPETSKIYFRRKAVAATAWEAARSIFDKSSYKATVFVNDFEIRGSRLALSTALQGWYGGYSTAYFHESTDGGATWTEKPHALQGVQAALDSAGTSYVIGSLNSSTNGGLYCARKAAGGAWETPVRVHDGYPVAGGLQVVGSSLVAVSGAYGDVPASRTSTDGGRTWSAPVLAGILGNTPSGDVADGADVHLFYSSGATLSTGAHGQGDAMKWAGNVYAWPADGALTSADYLWINAETWPAGTAGELYLVYSTDGVNWQGTALSLAGLNGNNDTWHVNLGTFAAGTHVRYAIEVIDNRGTVTWLNNGGQDYHAHVNP